MKKAAASENNPSPFNYYLVGFDLLPSSEELTDDELLFTLDQDESRGQMKGIFMSTVIQAICTYRDYDIILIDTGPSLDILTINSLAAAVDGVIISVSIDEQSLWSLYKFKANLRQIMHIIPGHEGVLGVILSPYDTRSQLLPMISSKIKEVLHMYLFETKIPRSNNAAKAVVSGVLFSMIYKPAYEAYLGLAQELLNRNLLNHEWVECRNSMMLKEMEKLRNNPEYADAPDEALIELVRERYSQGLLWDMPDSDMTAQEVIQ